MDPATAQLIVTGAGIVRGLFFGGDSSYVKRRKNLRAQLEALIRQRVVHPQALAVYNQVTAGPSAPPSEEGLNQLYTELVRAYPASWTPPAGGGAGFQQQAGVPGWLFPAAGLGLVGALLFTQLVNRA